MFINPVIFKETRSQLVLVIVIFALIQICTIWNGGDNGVFNSPDANVNYHFAERLYSWRSLSWPLASVPPSSADWLAPRSARVIDHGNLVPASFLGLTVIYGLLSRLLFSNVIAYLTVIFSVAGLLYFYALLKNYLEEKTALLATILLLIHPAWWYYTYDSLFPNVLFISLTLAGFYYLRRALSNSGVPYLVISPVLFFLALWVRTSEALWLLPIICSCWYFSRQKGVTRNYVMFWLFMLIPSALVWFWQSSLFQQSIPLGYNIASLGAPNWTNALGAILLPFGFHIKSIAKNFINYDLLIFWPYSLLIVASLVSQASYIWRHQYARRYLAACLFSVAVIALYYGSWTIADHPNIGEVTISVSYVRYFLPLYVMFIPFAAIGLSRWTAKMANRRLLQGAVVGAILIFSWRLVFLDADDGILARYRILRGYDAIAAEVERLTPDSAVIISGKADKYLWPRRSVIVGITDRGALTAVGAIIEARQRPIYYVSNHALSGGSQELELSWRPYGYKLGGIIIARENFYLYEIVPVGDEGSA